MPSIIVNKLICRYVVCKGSQYVVGTCLVCGQHVVGKGGRYVVGKGSRYVFTILLYVFAFVCTRTQMLAKVFTNKHDCTCIGIGGIASWIFCMSTHNKKNRVTSSVLVDSRARLGFHHNGRIGSEDVIMSHVAQFRQVHFFFALDSLGENMILASTQPSSSSKP